MESWVRWKTLLVITFVQAIADVKGATATTVNGTNNMKPQYSDFRLSLNLYKKWRLEKARWLMVQSFVLFTMMTALMLSTGLQAQL